MLQNIIRAAFSVVILAGFCGQAAAEPNITITHKLYKISGSNIEEIKQAISVSGPKDQNGRGYAANTDYDISWHFTYDRSGSECRIAAVKTFVKITYNMPELANLSEVNTDVADQWNAYFTALKNHEDGHAQKGVDAANAIERTLMKLPGSSNCRALGKRANALGKRIIDQYHNENLEYDTLTMHGILQGVTWARG